jgi:integrase
MTYSWCRSSQLGQGLLYQGKGLVRSDTGKTSDLMGHAKISMTKDAYVHRGELHADAAVYLDAADAD